MDPENKPDGQTPAPDNTQTPGDDAGGEFDLVEAIDAAYDDLDEQGNVKAKTDDKTPAQPGDKPDGQTPGEGDDGKTGAGEPGEGEGKSGEQKPDEKETGESKESKEGEADPDLELTAEEREQLGERATQRFEKLVERVKTEAEEKQQIVAERDQYREQHESLAGVLRDTHASTEQLSEVLDLTTELVSGDPARGQRAVERGFAMIRDYARHYGVSLPQASLLEAYPDLQQKVDDGSMTQEAAEENARLRSVQASHEAQRNREAQASSQQQQFQQAANQAFTEWQQLQQQWQKSDPDFAQKRKLMQDYEKQLADGVMNGRVHPSQVTALMRDRYDTISKTMATVAATMRDQKPREPNPLRPGTPRSGGHETPNYASTAEAIEAEYAKL